MSMYNLTEYSDNYSDTAASLWQFRRNESPAKDAGNPADVSTVSTVSYKNQILLMVMEFLKYLSSFWQSLEMSLINFKIHLELN